MKKPRCKDTDFSGSYQNPEEKDKKIQSTTQKYPSRTRIEPSGTHRSDRDIHYPL